jgi:AcrR family transcriptional regulator
MELGPVGLRRRAGKSAARRRILDAAYDLFSQHGTRAVGIDAVIEHSGVARMTLYRHFGSKDELVLEFLKERERIWMHGWFELEVSRRAEGPRQRLLAIFDVFDEWFQTDPFEGCSFINVLLEFPSRSSKLRQATLGYLANVRVYLTSLAAEAGIRDPEAFARKWHLLMKGAIISAQEGDRDAAKRARETAELILDAAS